MGDLSKLLEETVDQIEDDEKFMETEYDIIHQYCREHRYQLTESDMATIVGRGLECSYTTWKRAYIEELWSEFGEVTMNPETELIESEWNDFPAGTHREDIWHWFEDTFDVSVGEDLMGL